jgi:hypothetical protein
MDRCAAGTPEGGADAALYGDPDKAEPFVFRLTAVSPEFFNGIQDFWKGAARGVWISEGNSAS